MLNILDFDLSPIRKNKKYFKKALNETQISR